MEEKKDILEFKVDKRKNILKIKNQFNMITLTNFNEREIDLFFAILTQFRDIGTQKIRFYSTELKELANRTDFERNKVLVQDLKSMGVKMMTIVIKEENEKYIHLYNLFTDWKYNKDGKYIEMGIREEFTSWLNNCVQGYMKLDIDEIMELKTTHSKNLYVLLKQFRSTGRLYIEVDEFKKRLYTPRSYRFSDLSYRTIKPTVDELNEKGVFHNLQCEYLQKDRMDPRKVSHLLFTFTPETIDSSEENKYDLREKAGLIPVPVTDSKEDAIEAIAEEILEEYFGKPIKDASEVPPKRFWDPTIEDYIEVE